jgi:hypothetical protein
MCKPHTADKNKWLLFLVPALLFGDICHVGAEVLDQSFIASPQNLHAGIGPTFPGSIQEAQTFTVGITGALTRVNVFLEIEGSLPPPGTWFLDVRPTVNGVPIETDSLALASVTLPTSNSVQPVSFDLRPSGVSVMEGEVLAIVLGSDVGGGNGQFFWEGGIGNQYPLGEVFDRNLPNPVWSIPEIIAQAGGDLSFQTFVEPGVAAIPEPSTQLLVGLGALCLFGCSLRWRKHL